METNPPAAYGAWLASAPPVWPDAAVRAAHNAFIDIVATMVGGAAEEAPARVFATVGQWGAGPSTAIGMGARLPPPWAALVNGTTAHVLDFDDNFDPAKAHATAVLAPAIFALAEAEGAGGAACIDAFIAGLQIMGRVGEGLNPRHRAAGWHGTSTVGAIGAAAACARLLGLDAERAAHALSIATSMAGGFITQFGTMTKPMHAGLAAKAGVLAASLARGGIDAGAATLDGKAGMMMLMAGPDPDRASGSAFVTEAIGDPLFILSHGLRAKRFPNCASAHRAMDALIALRAQHGFTAADIARIAVHAPAMHLANLMYTAPETPMQAKFSLEFALAALLVDGGVGLAHFDAATIARADIRALYPRIVRMPFDDIHGRQPTVVEIALNDGRTLSAEVLMAAGSIARPFATAQYWEKFDRCATGMADPARIARIRAALENLPGLPSLAPLMEPLRPAFGGQDRASSMVSASA